MTKKKLNLLLVVFSALLLSGCLGKQNEVKNDALFIQSSPVCSNDEICQKMWDAAGDWVQQYSPQGIEIYNDELIKSEEKELGSDEMEIVIKKIKQKDGSFKIVIDNSCSRLNSACTSERNNMLAFNKKLSAFMSVAGQKKTRQIFEENSEVKLWLERYTQLTAGYKADALSAMLHYPVSFIESDVIHVVSSQQELQQYLDTVKAKIEKVNGVYLKVDSINVFARNGRNLYVNAIINLYDIENTIVAAQQIGFHLVNIKGKWQMISAATHGE